MCGRVTRTYSWGQLRALMTLGDPIPGKLPEPEEEGGGPNLQQFYNIPPDASIEMLRLVDGELLFEALQWRLVPFWLKEPKRFQTFNAKSEEVRNKASFRGPIKTRRGLFPVSGFYEWKKPRPKAKGIPHYISLPDSEIMMMAALWDENTHPDVGPIKSFTILTCGPNLFMKDLHHRMPVILPPEAWAAWMDPDSPPDVIDDLMQPYQGDMQAHEVAPLKGDGPRLIEPVS